VGWFLALVVGFPLLVNRHPGAFPEWLPSWFFLAVVAIGFVGGGLLLKGLDLWRWHRLATSMGLERMGDAAAEEGFNPLEAYRGTFEGRQVTLDHVGNQSSEASDWTRVTAPHDGDPGGRLVVRERGLGGVSPSPSSRPRWTSGTTPSPTASTSTVRTPPSPARCWPIRSENCSSARTRSTR
jgi:hypothetical protein